MTVHGPLRSTRVPPSAGPRDGRERGSILRRPTWLNADMTTMDLHTGATRATVDADESTPTLPTTLAAEFRAAGIRDFSIEGTERAAFSSDASLFRLVPAAIAFPFD